MKITKYLAACACVLMAGSATMRADNCEIQLAVASIEQGENVPSNVEKHLETRLMNVATQNGIATENEGNQFFIAGRFDGTRTDVVPGPPARTGITTTLTIYIGDAWNQEIYASKSFELRGAGRSETLAYSNAMTSLNAKNGELVEFIDNAKAKIIAYYDNNYPNLLKKAKQAAAMSKFDEALFYTTMIPACCKGYDEAAEATLEYYQQYIDREGQQLMMAAQKEWATDPTELGGAAAFTYLKQIDPDSKSFADAKKLGEEIKNKFNKDDWNLEPEDPEGYSAEVVTAEPVEASSTSASDKSKAPKRKASKAKIQSTPSKAKAVGVKFGTRQTKNNSLNWI